MKEWNRNTMPNTKLHRVLKTDNDLWRWWQAQMALKGKDAVTFSQLTADSTTPALMVWADDGGAVR
jgi:hypothetical protein